jgi:spore coat protein U-like protein
MRFAQTGVIQANIDATSSIALQCTKGTPYTVGLDAGRGAGATFHMRLMTGAGATIGYNIYKDAGHASIWGDTAAHVLSGTGTGKPENLTAYGRVPPQPTPQPGAYADTITVTVTY